MGVAKSVFITIFGAQNNRPLRAAYFRFGIIGGGALALSILCAQAINSFSNLTHTSFSLPTLLIMHIALIQACACCILLPASHILHGSRYDTVTRLLTLLPISSRSRWFLLAMPGLLLTFLGILLYGLPAIVLFVHLGLPLWLCLVNTVLAPLSILGIIRAVPASYQLAGWAAAATALYGQYVIIKNLLEHPYASNITIIAMISTYIIGTLYLLFQTNTTPDRHRPGRHSKIYLVSFTAILWHIKKIYRSPYTRLSAVSALIISIGICYLDTTYALLDASNIAFLGMLMASSHGVDIRCISRAYNPAEITCLRGTNYFLMHVWTGLIISGLVVCIPFGLRLHAIEATNLELFIFIVQWMAGLSIGLCLSTVLLPRPRDILPQFGAVILCSGILVACNKMPWVESGSPGPVIVLYACLTLSALTIAYITEYKKHPHYWRNHVL